MTTFIFVEKICRFVITGFLKLSDEFDTWKYFCRSFYYYFRFQKYEYVSILAFYVLLFSCTAISTLCKLQRQVRKKSLQVAKSLFVLKLVNPLFFWSQWPHWGKKNRLNRLQMDFSAPFCFQVTKLRKEDKNGFFFLHKKRAFLYVFVCKTMRNRKWGQLKEPLLHVCQ